jgi:hypothetical protein
MIEQVLGMTWQIWCPRHISFQGNFGAQQGKFGADDKAILCPVAQF